MPTMPDEVTCTIRGVTGPNSRGEIAAVSAVETGLPADTGQHAALLIRGGYVITMDPGTGDIAGGDVTRARATSPAGMCWSAGERSRRYGPGGTSDAVSCAGRASVW